VSWRSWGHLPIGALAGLDSRALIAQDARIGESLTFALHVVILIALAAVLALRSSRRACGANMG
jgi:hypothetical protein